MALFRSISVSSSDYLGSVLNRLIINKLMALPLWPTVLVLCLSCSENLDDEQRVQNFIQEFNLKKNEQTSPNALRFESIGQARKFLLSLKNQDLSLDEKKKLAFVIAKNSNQENSLLQGIQQTSLHEKQRMLSQTAGGARLVCNPPASGTASFSQGYMPWNSISTSLRWNGNTLVDLSTRLSGWTFGLSWNQSSWNQIGWANNVVRFEFNYSTSLTLFVEGVGEFYTTEYRYATGDYNLCTGIGHIYEY